MPTAWLTALMGLCLVANVIQAHSDGRESVFSALAKELLDLGDRCVRGVEIKVCDYGNAAIGCEAKRDFLADAAPGSGDNNRHSSIKSRQG